MFYYFDKKMMYYSLLNLVDFEKMKKVYEKLIRISNIIPSNSYEYLYELHRFAQFNNTHREKLQPLCIKQNIIKQKLRRHLNVHGYEYLQKEC